MSDLFGWAGLLVSVVAALIAYVAFIRRHRHKRLSYLVLRQDRLGPRSSYFPLEVFYAEKPVADPVISVIRILNSGEEPLSPEDFEIPIRLDFGAPSSIRAAAVVSRRPADLNPQLRISAEGRVLVDPLLLNTGDMFEIQLLTSGVPQQMALLGRVKGLTEIERVRQLPYPPGSGGEGQMNATDKFVWFVFGPLSIVLFLVFLILPHLSHFDVDPALTTATWAVVVIGTLVGYFSNLRRLVRKRRMWRP